MGVFGNARLRPYDVFAAPIESLTGGRGGHGGGRQAGRFLDVAPEGAEW